MPTPLERYTEILDELLTKRATRLLDEDTEEAFVVALNDCRQDMSLSEEAQIEKLVDERTSLQDAIFRASCALLALRRDPRAYHEDVDRNALERVQLDILSTVPREYWHRLVDEQGRRLLNLEQERS